MNLLVPSMQKLAYSSYLVDLVDLASQGFGALLGKFKSNYSFLLRFSSLFQRDHEEDLEKRARMDWISENGYLYRARASVRSHSNS